MLKRLALRHVGPVDDLQIDFAPRVNLITGDNGLGKSFLLDLAWWTSTGIEARYPARPQGDQDDASVVVTSERGARRFTTSARFAWIAREQAWSLGAEQRLASGQGVPTELVIYAAVDGGFAICDPLRSAHAYTFNPTEVWDGLWETNPKDAPRTRWLCEGLIRDWASWQKENGKAFQQLCQVLKALSPHPEEQLEPGALTRISLDDNRDMPTLKTPYGREVAIVHASAAIRRIAALAYLLVWTWQEHKMASKLLKEPPATDILLLVDEMEAHLHPAWQRRILRSLMNVTDALAEADQIAVQIIAVTHSPMLLASIEPVFDPNEDALWLFELVDHDGSKSVQLRRDEWHRRGDASAWLKSEIFALGEARSVEAEVALAAARAFMQRNSADGPAFQHLYDQLRAALPGDDPFWMTWRGWAWRHGLLDEATP